MRNENATCTTCPWFHADEAQPQCRRNPPLILAIDITDDADNIYRVPTSMHPVVNPTSWCGSHPDLLPTGNDAEEQFMGMSGSGA